MAGDQSKSRTSLCTTKNDSGYDFHYFCISKHVWSEVLEAIDQCARSPLEAAHLTGEVLGRLRAAAKGRLAEDPQVFEPVRRNPELWEIKWKFKLGREFRMYHAEPGLNPHVVALRFHRKATDGTADQIEDEQNSEMDLAGARFTDHAAARWGHKPRQTCPDCLAC